MKLVIIIMKINVLISIIIHMVKILGEEAIIRIDVLIIMIFSVVIFFFIKVSRSFY